MHKVSGNFLVDLPIDNSPTDLPGLPKNLNAGRVDRARPVKKKKGLTPLKYYPTQRLPKDTWRNDLRSHLREILDRRKPHKVLDLPSLGRYSTQSDPVKSSRAYA
jgi:hypothetical protein